MKLFELSEGTTIPNPRNNHERVLHTLIFPPKQLTIAYWWDKFRCTKWSSRLGEIERKLNMELVKRHNEKWTDCFGAHTYYTVYTPHLDKKIYIHLYTELQSKK